MIRIALAALLASTVACPVVAAPEAIQATAGAVVSRCVSIYKESGHPCACPDDLAKNGSRCGRRSAHDRPNGAAPICLASEVTPDLEKDFGTNTQTALRERCHYHGR